VCVVVVGSVARTSSTTRPTSAATSKGTRGDDELATLQARHVQQLVDQPIEPLGLPHDARAHLRHLIIPTGCSWPY
jgi:hypothetical protein